MNRRFTLTLGAMGLLASGGALYTSKVAAQTKTLKESIIGTWEITSVYDQYEDGKKNSPFGAGVTGRYVFGSDGSFTHSIIGEPQAEMKSNDPRRPDSLIVIFLGRYTVDEAKKTISYKIEHAGYSARNGSEQSLSVTFNGDTASFAGSSRKDQIGTFSPHFEVKRFK